VLGVNPPSRFGELRVDRENVEEFSEKPDFADSWINGNCSRFDFFTTDTEYQLKNKRLCG